MAAFFILRDNSCVPIGAKNYDKLEPIQIAGAIAGGVLFILSFFNIANVLYDIKIVFFAVSCTTMCTIIKLMINCKQMMCSLCSSR